MIKTREMPRTLVLRLGVDSTALRVSIVAHRDKSAIGRTPGRSLFSTHYRIQLDDPNDHGKICETLLKMSTCLAPVAPHRIAHAGTHFAPTVDVGKGLPSIHLSFYLYNSRAVLLTMAKQA